MRRGPVVCIERTDPRDGIPEHPVWKEGRGFVLGDPKHGRKKHHEENEIYAATLDEAAAYVERGFSLRMGRVGEAGSLISPAVFASFTLTFMADVSLWHQLSS